MAKKNPWQIATFVLIGFLVLGLITGFIVLGNSNSIPNSNKVSVTDRNVFTLDSMDIVPDPSLRCYQHLMTMGGQTGKSTICSPEITSSVINNGADLKCHCISYSHSIPEIRID